MAKLGELLLITVVLIITFQLCLHYEEKAVRRANVMQLLLERSEKDNATMDAFWSIRSVGGNQ